MPGIGKQQSDYSKVDRYASTGVSKAQLADDFGNPAEIERSADEEVWTYLEREDGKTFRFFFDGSGRLVDTKIE